MAGKLKQDLTESGKMPVLFIGHGSPINTILDNDFTRSLSKLGKSLPRPEAIMVISAHWLTKGTYVTCTERQGMIYDFYGFPEELYKIKYPAPGSPHTAGFVTELVHKVHVSCSYDWGLDHASWAILRHIFPKADIPVFEMSLDYSFNDWHPKPIQYHYELASELAVLREKGILIIGSGNIVHNLGLIDFHDIDVKPYDWGVRIDEKIKSHLISHNHKELINYQNMGKEAYLAAPTLDHYLPMIYAIALQGKNELLTFIYEDFQNASISMRCFQIG
ncbi:MAG: 4,5-DOPA dioxygenase extradiol [Candidatus Methanoperedens sp.]|nr:4,5-DOPA dioxygenase extradiol [Candidatus Methanoperedens sp.]MCE8429468.1 4,5-DOPA dioxygenase extradiol [Candidatus Methanoperedens sp.]